MENSADELNDDEYFRLYYSEGGLANQIFNAVSHGKIETVQNLLLKHKFSNYLRFDEVPLLYTAAEYGQTDIVKIFLDNGFSIDCTSFYTGATPLMVAARKNHEETVRLLISRGADIHATDDDCWNALHHACSAESKRIVQLLLDHGALSSTDDFNFNQREFSIWEILSQFVEKYEELFKMILNHETNNSRTRKYMLPSVIMNGNIQIVELILNRGLDIESLSADDLTPLCLAVRYSPEIVKILLDRGANVNSNISESNTTALHQAALMGRLEVVQLLVSNGAEVNAMETNGLTPLHCSAQTGHREISEYFLEKGGEINTDDIAESQMYHIANGTSMVNHAYRPGYVEIAKLFVKEIVRMQLQGLPVKENNLRDIERATELSEFKKKCEGEIEEMRKNRFLNSTISLCDILKARSFNKLLGYAKNKDVIPTFKTEEIDKNYPIFAKMLKKHFDKAIRRQELLMRVCNFFHSLAIRIDDRLPRLGPESACEIMSYLDNEDLINLRRSYF